jgi:hypothetical protein
MTYEMDEKVTTKRRRMERKRQREHEEGRPSGGVPKRGGGRNGSGFGRRLSLGLLLHRRGPAAERKLSFLTSGNCFQEKTILVLVILQHALASSSGRFCFSRFYSSDPFSFFPRVSPRLLVSRRHKPPDCRRQLSLVL